MVDFELVLVRRRVLRRRRRRRGVYILVISIGQGEGFGGLVFWGAGDMGFKHGAVELLACFRTASLQIRSLALRCGNGSMVELAQSIQRSC